MLTPTPTITRDTIRKAHADCLRNNDLSPDALADAMGIPPEPVKSPGEKMAEVCVCVTPNGRLAFVGPPPTHIQYDIAVNASVGAIRNIVCDHGNAVHDAAVEACVKTIMEHPSTIDSATLAAWLRALKQGGE